jgi:hypothetical protein
MQFWQFEDFTVNFEERNKPIAANLTQCDEGN